MTVRCPFCWSDHELPDGLLGAWGARVRCPDCREEFTVERTPSDTTESNRVPALTEAAPAAASVSASHDPAVVRAATTLDPHAAYQALDDEPRAPAEPAEAARFVFDVLESILGEALARSRARGTVLSDHGPAIIAVWEEYRRRAGAEAPSAAFRAALRDRCGVDLTSVRAAPPA